MREFKFRAWDLRKKEFVNNEYLLTDSVNGTMKIAGVTYKQDPDDMDDEVDVSQFTGLQDDIDTDIYEGDLVQTMSLGILAIEWNDDTCKFQFSDGSDINDGENYGTSKLVVGNIYENPELVTPQPA